MAQGNRTYGNVVALAGGVGGAKLADGLQAVLPASTLSVVVNTADDFQLWGLHISPDIDTVTYTLAGLANPETGWGVHGDSWQGMQMLGRYGHDAWFRLGDMDIVTHVLRTQGLREGRTLSGVTAELAKSLGIEAKIMPMCDEPVMTIIETPDGPLEFQEYFVRHRHADVVNGVAFRGIEEARLTSRVKEALAHAEAIIFCPSNPTVSIGPILAVPGMLDALARSKGRRVAISPIVGGVALKGPAADMLKTLGYEVSPVGVAQVYKGIIDGMVIDKVDERSAAPIRAMGIAVEVADTIMTTQESRAELAHVALRLCESLSDRTLQT
ncbi:MAG: 2-phospho-L-lactate transferase [Chloroflexota bacterium]|nr:2-phospho-L-lactate transferase [Chloroflexota bacterium]